MTSRSIHPLQASAGSDRMRRLLADALKAASIALVRVARRLDGRRAPEAPHVLEFHADAGAPEGALYVDGQLVGHLPGLTRL